MWDTLHVIVVSWFLLKTMRQLTCTDRPYKANRQISYGTRMSSTYCTLAVQCKVPYARRCSYSSIA